MSVKIKLNAMEFRHEVYQTLNIFFSFKNIIFVEENEDYFINIAEDKLIISHKGDNKNYNLSPNFNKKEQIKKFIYNFFSDFLGVTHPWGILTGIRPSKIALSLIEKNLTPEEIIDYYKNNYLCSEEKAQLCLEVASYEKEFIHPAKEKVSIYIGMPFCPTRCLYCSFASNPINSNKTLIKPYVEALIKEIEEITQYISKNDLKVETVYFGGGTPTSVPEEDFEELMKNIYLNLIEPNKELKEFTVEAGRPDSITENKLRTMKNYGVSRISINPQTMNLETLKSIGRFHSVEEVIEKFNMAREYGFDNINMDIIVGLPGEKVSHIENTCREIMSLKPDSITVHGLSVKRASKLYEDICLEKKYTMPSQNEINRMYSLTKELARKLNMVPYYMYRQKNMIGNMENIGYSLPEKECLYNIQIMEEKQSIIALGADGISKIVFLEENRIERFANVKDVREYVNRVPELIEKKINLLNTLYR